MSGFGRKGCSDVYKGFTRKVTGVDVQNEGMREKDGSEIAVGRIESKESSKAPAVRRVEGE
jgi:protein-arginine kinase activator protein McsA